MRVLVGPLVEPVDCSAMLCTEARGHPDDGAGLRAGGVGDDLAEVDVVGNLQLILDNHDIPARLVVAQQVETEVTDGMLCSFEHKLHAE